MKEGGYRSHLASCYMILTFFSRSTAEVAMRKRVVVPAVLAAGVLAFTETAQAAELKVMGDSPLGPALSKVADVYRQEKQTQVELVLAPSPVVKEKIEAVEPADVVVVQSDFVEELTKSGKVSAGDRPMIGRVGIGPQHFL
jgi:molybdate transport system substrate-binding protein